MYIYNFTRNPPIPCIYPTFQPLNRQLTFHQVDQMANMVGPMTVWNRQSIPSGRNSFEASYPGKMENTIIPFHSKMCSPNSFHQEEDMQLPNHDIYIYIFFFPPIISLLAPSCRYIPINIAIIKWINYWISECQTGFIVAIVVGFIVSICFNHARILKHSKGSPFGNLAQLGKMVRF